MKLIDGRALASARRQQLKKDIRRSGMTPGLSVILIGSDPASKMYVSLKERAAQEAGMLFEKHLFPAETDEARILNLIDDLNHRTDIHGIVIQLPVPAPLSEDRLIERLDPRKDVDGFHPDNIRNLITGEPVQTPSLIRSVCALIDSTGTALHGKNTAIVGKNPVFTRPLEFILQQKGAHTHLATNARDARTILPEADIIITALGESQWITEPFTRDGAVIIDIAINTHSDGSVTGDVHQESVQSKAAWLSPVPGGVGPMTVACLLENTFESAKRSASI